MKFFGYFPIRNNFVSRFRFWIEANFSSTLPPTSPQHGGTPQSSQMSQ